MNKPVRLQVYWTGRVQGVGFRYTAETVAMELHLVGWVRNLPDGRVEAVCEGNKKTLETFLERMAQGAMRAYIKQTDVRWQETTGEFDDFQIRFY